MYRYDIVFIVETHCNAKLLEAIDGFQIIGDPLFNSSSFGGIAAYVNRRWSPMLQNIRFSKCSLSFSLSEIPGFAFMVVYVYPLDSINFNLEDFGILSEEVEYWNMKGFVIYFGGDFNSRMGNMNIISTKSLKWNYAPNVDTVINHHGRQLASICELNKVMPLNHCQYYNTIFDGRYTYYKAGNNSQIDFVLTNKNGRKYVTNFKIIDTMWHLSDHLPLSLHLCLPLELNSDVLLIRAMELCNPYEPARHNISYRFNFNIEAATALLEEKTPIILDSFKSNNPDIIVAAIEENLITVMKTTKIGKKKTLMQENLNGSQDECDKLFHEYIFHIQCDSHSLQIKEAYEKYQSARNKLDTKSSQFFENEYKEIINDGNEKDLWSKINWSGQHKQRNQPKIPMQEMTTYFETLYQPLDIVEQNEFDILKSSMYIPINDDPITEGELKQATHQMKKGGYDFPLSTLKLLMSCWAVLVLVLFNLIFYMSYPMRFGLSVLSTIPKKGNLRLMTNYRGIHVQNMMSMLYDRIIANRLLLWARIRPEQTAFQKGKSTIDQIFLLRVIIGLTKAAKSPLFIGFFDLEKAFDKVSRPLLLESLIKLGIGAALFTAIKAMYSSTRIIIKSGSRLSEIFSGFSGIKQGAPSSVVLFVIFMDQFIDIVRERCVKEPVIGVLHLLLHADDTAVVSTTKDLFIIKCNVLLDAFKAKRVSLNIKKSGFMVINPSTNGDRTDIELTDGILYYNPTFVYLGATFSDTGTVMNDVNLFAEGREKSVFVKLANFMRNNNDAPYTVKRKILNSCLNASLLYSCETWGGVSLKKIEALYRKAIKITLGIKKNTPNEIIYAETGLIELKVEIRKRQFLFWQKVLKKIEEDPSSVVSVIILSAINNNIHYLRHYKELSKFKSVNDCYGKYKDDFNKTMKDMITKKLEKGKCLALQDYMLLNKSLVVPDFYKTYLLSETDRKIVTRYRTGSNFLKTTTGYYSRTAIEDRLCKCGHIQNLEHVIFKCPYTSPMRHGDFPDSLEGFFINHKFAAIKLRCMDKLLKLRK